MSIRLLRGVAIGVVVVLVAAGIHTLVLRSQAAPADSAFATVQAYTGVLDVMPPGTNQFLHAYDGQPVVVGSTVRAEADSKGGITFPDGSSMRLDAFGQVRIERMRPASSGDWEIGLLQQSGWSWVRSAADRPAALELKAPNESNIRSRGGELAVLTGTGSHGQMVTVVDAWSGMAEVADPSGRSRLAAGEMTLVEPSGRPTVPQALPVSHHESQWTIFNHTLDLVPGTPRLFTTNALPQGQSSEPQVGGPGDGKSDLAFTLGSSASVYQLTVLDPQQRAFQRFKASHSVAVSLIIPRPRAGEWGYEIENLRSASPTAVWWMVFSVIAPSTHTPRPFFTTPTPCDHTVQAGHSDRWTVSSLDSIGPPVLGATGLPSYARFVDNGNGTGTVTVSPDRAAAATDLTVQLTSSLAGETGRLTCVEHVLNPRNDATQAAPSPPPASPNHLLSPPPAISPPSGGGPAPTDVLPTPMPGPSPTPSSSPAPGSSGAPAPVPTMTSTPRPSIPVPSVAPTPTPTDTSTPTPAPTPSDTSTPTPTPAPSATPTATPPPSPSPTNSASPTASPSDSASPSPSSSP